jgi:hypothetical protein
MEILWAILLFLGLLVGWCLTLFNLPGNWVMVGLAALYAWLGPAPDEQRAGLGWEVVIALIVLALLGELIELAAGGLGAKRSGGSKRAAVLSVVGSFAGSIVGGIVGLPFLGTVVGTILGVIVFAALGALGGAMLGEAWKGRTLGESWKVGEAAFWGRVLGTLAKVIIAGVMVATASTALCV